MVLATVQASLTTGVHRKYLCCELQSTCHSQEDHEFRVSLR